MCIMLNRHWPPNCKKDAPAWTPCSCFSSCREGDVDGVSVCHFCLSAIIGMAGEIALSPGRWGLDNANQCPTGWRCASIGARQHCRLRRLADESLAIAASAGIAGSSAALASTGRTYSHWRAPRPRP